MNGERRRHLIARWTFLKYVCTWDHIVKVNFFSLNWLKNGLRQKEKKNEKRVWSLSHTNTYMMTWGRKLFLPPSILNVFRGTRMHSFHTHRESLTAPPPPPPPFEWIETFRKGVLCLQPSLISTWIWNRGLLQRWKSLDADSVCLIILVFFDKFLKCLII